MSGQGGGIPLRVAEVDLGNAGKVCVLAVGIEGKIEQEFGNALGI